MIKDILIGKFGKEAATILGQEFAKIGNIPRTNVKFSGADFDIEVVELKPIEGGVEVFVKAWNKDKQIGFGDGTVEIERIRIFNPPYMILDPLGDIIRTWTDSETGQLKESRQKEDLKQALLNDLAHTIKIVGKDGKNIISGKRGFTVSTFNPGLDSDGGRTSCDGIASDEPLNQTWANKRGGAGDFARDNNTITNEVPVRINRNGSGTTWDTIVRGFFLFDTSSIPDADPINSATFSFYTTAIRRNINANQECALVLSTTASNTDIAATDFSGTNGNTTKQATNLVLSSMTANAFNDWTLNATGLGNISKTGITKFGLRLENDRANIEPPTGSDAQTDDVVGHLAEQGTNLPKLVVDHGVAANSGFFAFMGPQPQV